ncbi:hypothetical protein D3C71_1341880 [compost metagenome]
MPPTVVRICELDCVYAGTPAQLAGGVFGSVPMTPAHGSATSSKVSLTPENSSLIDGARKPCDQLPRTIRSLIGFQRNPNLLLTVLPKLL